MCAFICLRTNLGWEVIHKSIQFSGSVMCLPKSAALQYCFVRGLLKAFFAVCGQNIVAQVWDFQYELKWERVVTKMNLPFVTMNAELS